MKKLEVGYNFIEKASIIKGNYEKIDNKMSILQFFKNLERKNLPSKFAIMGFDVFLYQIDESEERELHQYIHRILSEHSNYLLRYKPIIEIIIEEKLVMNKTYKILYRGKKISLTDIFGKTLTPRGLDWFHSNFSLS
ncbi:MAG: hypothetical protein ACTSRG_19880 [Candidatus Helarchaeota archaeon]